MQTARADVLARQWRDSAARLDRRLDDWVLREAHMSYEVLNACRVLRYLNDGKLVGKVAAAQ
jgi:hypothetical protein